MEIRTNPGWTWTPACWAPHRKTLLLFFLCVFPQAYEFNFKIMFHFFLNTYLWLQSFTQEAFYLSGHMKGVFIDMSQHTLSSWAYFHLPPLALWQWHPSPRITGGERGKRLWPPPLKLLFQGQEGSEDQRCELASIIRNKVIRTELGFKPRLVSQP